MVVVELQNYWIGIFHHDTHRNLCFLYPGKSHKYKDLKATNPNTPPPSCFEHLSGGKEMHNDIPSNPGSPGWLFSGFSEWILIILNALARRSRPTNHQSTGSLNSTQLSSIFSLSPPLFLRRPNDMTTWPWLIHKFGCSTMTYPYIHKRGRTALIVKSWWRRYDS